MKWEFLIVAFFLSSWATAQNLSNLNTAKIVELECEQSSQTGTFVSASMERTQSGSRVLIHRSEDLGVSWQLIDSIVPSTPQGEIPDPVLTVDPNGKFSLVVMRVLPSFPNIDATKVNLEYYRSSDDGQSWNLVSLPHENDSIADYPQIIHDLNGNLYLSYAYIVGYPQFQTAKPYFTKSIDGGQTWSLPIDVSADTMSVVGADLAFGKDSVLVMTLRERDTGLVHVFQSFDLGSNWNHSHTFPVNGSELTHVTKPVFHPNFDDFGVFSHQPHKDHTAIYFHGAINGNSVSYILDSGAYAEAMMTDDQKIHVVYNQKNAGQFQMLYRFSEDQGLSFSQPVILYSGNYDESGQGEYQSFLLGNDGLFCVTFSDWSDGGKAKMLVFPPEFNSVNEAEISRVKMYPNPASETLQIEWRDVAPDKVKIRDCTGKVVFSEQAYMDESLAIDVSAFPSGIYFVEMHLVSRVIIRQLIIE